MRFPSLETDFWTLESGEDRHEENPDSFWIPDRETRENLSRGDAAKLIFVIEADDNGAVVTSTERMWVIVSEAFEDGYIGVLTNQPDCTSAQDTAWHLRIGCEVPFRPEHIIGTDQTPQGYVTALFSEPPTPAWKDR